METNPPLIRRVTPLILGVVLIILAALALSRMFNLRQELAGNVVDQLEDDLQDRVAAWEASLTDQLSQWAEVAGSDPYQGSALQDRMRIARPYFDSLYIWWPAERITTRQGVQESPGKYQYPRPTYDESRDVNAPCLVRGRTLTSQPESDALQVTAAYRAWCRNASPSVRIIALTESLTRLLEENLYVEATYALETDGQPSSLTLRDAAARGLPPFRMMVLKMQRAEVLSGEGDREAAYDTLYQLGHEIAELDAPDLQALLGWMPQTIKPVRDAGRTDQVAQLESERRRATRRLGAFREITQNLLSRIPPSEPEPGRYISDPYGDDSFLMYTRWAQGGQVGVALQLDQQLLLRDLLRNLKRFRNQLVIRDSDGKHYAGARREIPVAIEVPLSTLPHLRVGLLQSAVDIRTRRLDKEWIIPAALAGLLLLGGFIALFEQVRATRRQALLLQRQREFATRVTHELKTPLAGIKVMAENLEYGMYKDASDRQAMARAIVQEADNLTARVNEILSVAKEQKLRDPEPFDPEEAVLEAVDAWGPRLHAAGLEFVADLHPTDEVMGDMEAVRDAVACLLDNALKYHDPQADPPGIWLTLQQDGRWIRIAVEDNGIGVPANMRASIFDPFVRVEGPNRGKSGGHGLGLNQVAKIMTAHKGRARAEEGRQGGSRFVLELPALT